LRLLRQNSRYELLAAPVLYYFGKGFYGPEVEPNGESHWMSQDGQLMVQSSESALTEFEATIVANPVLQDERLSFQLNAAPVGADAKVRPEGGIVRFAVPFRRGSNILLVHSSSAPIQANVFDRRLLSSRFLNVSMHRLDTSQQNGVARR
jgi:hypothetical protein